MKRSEGLDERLLARLWQEEAPRLGPLTCNTGHRLWVLYPGRPSVQEGPDFRDALLLTQDGTLVRGDVELHLEAKGWFAHGHHQDRAYQRVVLHVTLWPAPGGDTPLVLGLPMPQVALLPALSRLKALPLPQRFPTPSPWLALARLRRHEVARLLDRAGDARFRSRVRAFLRQLTRGARPPCRGGPLPDLAERAAQLLYQGLMEALGYRRNREPFLALALGLPLRLLRRALGGTPPRERPGTLLALFLGAGGLLPEAPRLQGVARDELEGRWHALGLEPLLPREAWRTLRIRPSNHPVRRLWGMALLLDRFWEEGLLQGLLERVATGPWQGVQEALLAPAPEGPALIGPGRAGDMAINVLLPFCAAWGELVGNPALTRQARALYRAWPPLEENALTREARHLLGLPHTPGQEGVSLTARRQQGLLHLYHRGHPGAPRLDRGGWEQLR